MKFQPIYSGAIIRDPFTISDIENLTLTVIFDSANLVIYDNANGKVLPAP